MRAYELANSLAAKIRDEYENTNILPMDDDFYLRTADDIRGLNVSGESGGAVKEHLIDQLLTLLRLRAVKLLSGAEESFATKNEKHLLFRYKEFQQSLKLFVECIRSPELSSQHKRFLVNFNSAMEAFIDSTMNLVGPFKKGDMAYIPEADALILSRYGLIEVLVR